MKLDKNKIEIRLAELSMSITKLCKLLNMKNATLNYSLRAKNVRPTTVSKIATALSVEPKDIIKMED